MKKLSIALICFLFFSTPAFCLISDDFAEKTLNKNVEIKKARIYLFVDDFAEKNQNKNYSIKPSVSFDEVTPKAPVKPYAKKIPVIDERDFKTIKVRIKDYFTTRKRANEGDFIDFVTIEDTEIGNKNYPKGTIVKARIETISPNFSGGVPADLTVGSFILDDINLQGEIEKTGANRTLWVCPASIAGDFIFLGLGELSLLIRGGHAKIKPKETFTLYYKFK